jgi:hypothetical protein
MAVAKRTTASRRKPIAVKNTKVVSIQSGDETANSTKIQKIYVIDTSVLLHDHNCINSFEDNRIAIPITGGFWKKISTCFS